MRRVRECKEAESQAKEAQKRWVVVLGEVEGKEGQNRHSWSWGLAGEGQKGRVSGGWRSATEPGKG